MKSQTIRRLLRSRKQTHRLHLWRRLPLHQGKRVQYPDHQHTPQQFRCSSRWLVLPVSIARQHHLLPPRWQIFSLAHVACSHHLFHPFSRNGSQPRITPLPRTHLLRPLTSSCRWNQTTRPIFLPYRLYSRNMLIAVVVKIVKATKAPRTCTNSKLHTRSTQSLLLCPNPTNAS